MKLTNPPCKKARKCQPFCGMCHLDKTARRIITTYSLFGECRKKGKCVCLTWSHTANCLWLNGSKNGHIDCLPKEHPHHHKTVVNDSDIQAIVEERKRMTFEDRIERQQRLAAEIDKEKKYKYSERIKINERSYFNGRVTNWRLENSNQS